MGWAALFGGPIGGALLVVGYVISRFGERGPPGSGAVVAHAIAVLLVLLAVPGAVHVLRADPEARRRPVLTALALCALPCALWVLNSVWVVWSSRDNLIVMLMKIFVGLTRLFVRIRADLPIGF
jgi:hypothetical protein